jgi:VWFA-related protein
MVRFGSLQETFMRWPIRLAVSVLATTALHAQTSPRPSLFKSGVELVRLDVRITDDDGRPITDIAPSELQISEDGRVRPILQFQHIEEPRGRTYAEAAQRTIASEVSTNRGAPRGHLYVLVFDSHHITAGNEMRARSAAQAFLRARLRPEDRVAIYALPGPGASLYFSGNTEKAVAALDKVTGSLTRVGLGVLGSMSVYEAYQIARGDDLMLSRIVGGYSNAAALRDVTSDVARASGDDPRVFRQLVREDAGRIVRKADEDARQFLLRLADLLHTLKLYEGRKAVLLFSEGFFTDHVTRELDEVAAAAAQSYSVVYSLDLNSRMNEPAAGAPTGGDQFQEIQSRIEPLGALAQGTDGELVTDANQRLASTLQRIGDTSQDYYLVGFEPAAGARNKPNTYRHVHVAVKRPGAHVSTRTGYSLSADKPLDRRLAIDAALAAPYPLQGIPIDYTTYVLASETPGYANVVLSLSAELPVSREGHGSADVVFAAKRVDDGRIVASGTDTIRLPRATSAGAATGMATYLVQFGVPPGDCLMRVVVREPGGGVGSADRRFEVRSFGGRGLTAGDLILNSTRSAGRLPVHATAYAADVLSGVVELYGRSAADVDRASVALTLAAVGADAPVSSTIASLTPVKPAAIGVSQTADVMLSLDDVAPGPYVVTARVKDSNGETVAELRRDVEVRPGGAPAVAAGDADAAQSSIDPREVLRGDVTRAFVATLRQQTPELSKAADAAIAGDWEAVERAVPLERTSPAAIAVRGLVLFARGEYEKALEALTAARDRDPQNARVAFLIGWAARALDRHRDAVTAWRNAAYLDPSLVPAHLALADLYLELSQPALAAQALRAGLAAVPDSPELADKLSRVPRP